METLANESGCLNRQLVAKTRGITLLWYLLLAELDFLVFGIAGLTAISLLYAKQFAFFVFNLFRLVDDVTSDPDRTSASEDSSVSSKFEESENEIEQESEQSLESEDSSNSSKLEESYNEAEQHSERSLGSQDCPDNFQYVERDDETQQKLSESYSSEYEE